MIGMRLLEARPFTEDWYALYSDDQPSDEGGRWTDGGGSSTVKGSTIKEPRSTSADRVHTMTPVRNASHLMSLIRADVAAAKGGR